MQILVDLPYMTDAHLLNTTVIFKQIYNNNNKKNRRNPLFVAYSICYNTMKFFLAYPSLLGCLSQHARSGMHPWSK